MKRQMTVNQGTELEYTTSVAIAYSVIRSEITAPEAANGEGNFAAKIWGLASYIPNDDDWHMAMYGSFRRDGRHVEYGASVIFEDGEMIHNPYDEMIDDIAFLM